MVEVVVEYDYEALHEDELTIRLGDVIKNVRKLEEEGWLEGDLNGRRGVFPDNFVKEIKKETESKDELRPVRRERSSGNVASLVQRMSTYGFPAGGFQPQSNPRSFRRKSKKRQCRALFEYFPQNEDELELKMGDVIDINEEVEEGWWSGTMNGKSGLFPSNFVKEIEPTEDNEMNDVSDESENTSKDSLVAGTPVSPLASPVSDNGVVAQPKKVRGVGFGDIFKEGSVKLKVRLPSSESEEKKSEKPLPSLPSAAKPAHLSMTESVKVEGDNKIKEYCKVLFPFDSTNEDELSLKEGDIILILNKSTGEPGWWKGELHGKEGVFPDNFVAVISEAEKDAATSKVPSKLSPSQDDDKPKKPPPPAKISAPKPEVPSGDKKPLQAKLEEKGDKPVPDKPAKPAAPIVPPKKPAVPPGKGSVLLRTGTVPPKRPDKPQLPPPGPKPNGEVPSIRPKSEFEPTPPSKPKTLSGDWGDKAVEIDLISFDELNSTSGKLSHPTTSRPKMPGRRLPTQFAGGHSTNKEIIVEKNQKMEEEEITKPKLSDFKKPSLLNPTAALPSKPASAVVTTVNPKPKAEVEEESKSEVEDLKAQIMELLHTVELLKEQQMKEIAELRNDLDEEKSKRKALQMEIERLKKMVQST
ncbi:CD2-associated protein isoform X1 [Lepisosteus oculatus]|uniref:Osteoclast-stimulating factor 1 n=1 Tax=Lepisosteus oculatus TaxID=7918 RepID=W5NID0_LEPOC|nr:PREDICTED: CD2-associated protein [Lepisosteus oculatus]